MNKVDEIVNTDDVQNLVESLATSFQNISSEKIVELLPKLIKHVQKYKKLSGEDKKSLIIKILNLIIDKTDGPGDDEIFDPILKRLVPILIDTFVKIDKKGLKIKKPSCLGRLFLCM